MGSYSSQCASELGDSGLPARRVWMGSKAPLRRTFNELRGKDGSMADRQRAAIAAVGIDRRVVSSTATKKDAQQNSAAVRCRRSRQQPVG
jgi:hypothetical protein